VYRIETHPATLRLWHVGVRFLWAEAIDYTGWSNEKMWIVVSSRLAVGCLYISDHDMHQLRKVLVMDIDMTTINFERFIRKLDGRTPLIDLLLLIGKGE